MQACQQSETTSCMNSRTHATWHFSTLSTACNILMDDHEGVFTLSTRGDGVARNCTLTTLLFAGNFQILESTMSGVSSGEEGPDAPVCHAFLGIEVKLLGLVSYILCTHFQSLNLTD